MGDVFRKFDKDGSGDLDLGEIKQALAELGLKVDANAAAEVLQRYDTDRSGRLSLKEFRPLVKELKGFQQSQLAAGGQPAGSPPLPPPAGTGETVGQIFRRMDKDGSGDLDIGEVREALGALGLQADGAAAAEILQRYDADRSGRLSLPEFRALAKELKNFQASQR